MFPKAAKSFLVAIAILLSPSVASATFQGYSGDGISDFIYYSETGALWVDPDGDSVGLFYIVSEYGIFVGEDPVFPPGGLFLADSDTEIGWASLDSHAFTEPWYLGRVAFPWLFSDFLHSDIVISRGSDGFAHPNRDFGLRIIYGPEPSSLVLFALGILGLLAPLRRR